MSQGDSSDDLHDSNRRTLADFEPREDFNYPHKFNADVSQDCLIQTNQEN